jgi:hypothetical protein
VVVRDTNQNNLHSVSGTDAERGAYLKPGSYLLDLTSSNTYLDFLPVTITAGGDSMIDLRTVYADIKIIPPNGYPTPGFDLRDPSGQNSLHTVDDVQASQGVYVTPGSYQLLLPNDHGYLDGVAITALANATSTIDLGKIYGRLMVTQPNGSAASAFDVKRSLIATSLSTIDPNQGHAGIFLKRGKWFLVFGDSRFIDASQVTIKPNTRQTFDVASSYATLRIRALPNQSVSYKWTSPVDHTEKSESSSDAAQIFFVHPGTYSIEVSTTNSRFVTVRAKAGKTLTLPAK